MSAPRTTAELVAAARQLAEDIDSPDGAPNPLCYELADRLEKLAPLELAAREFAEAEFDALSWPNFGELEYRNALDSLKNAAREASNV